MFVVAGADREKDPPQPGRVITTFPGTHKVKATNVPVWRLFYEMAAPGTAFRELMDRAVRIENVRAGKRRREWGEERNDLRLKQEELILAGKYDEAQALQPRIDQLAELTAGDTAGRELARHARLKKLGILERFVLNGPSTQTQIENLIRYMKRREVSLATTEVLFDEITSGGVKGINRETLDEYDGALEALRKKADRSRAR